MCQFETKYMDLNANWLNRFLCQAKSKCLESNEQCSLSMPCGSSIYIYVYRNKNVNELFELIE